MTYSAAAAERDSDDRENHCSTSVGGCVREGQDQGHSADGARYFRGSNAEDGLWSAHVEGDRGRYVTYGPRLTVARSRAVTGRKMRDCSCRIAGGAAARASWRRRRCHPQVNGGTQPQRFHRGGGGQPRRPAGRGERRNQAAGRGGVQRPRSTGAAQQPDHTVQRERRSRGGGGAVPPDSWAGEGGDKSSAKRR